MVLTEKSFAETAIERGRIGRWVASEGNQTDKKQPELVEGCFFVCIFLFIFAIVHFGTFVGGSNASQ
jgi:hypothetical protein